MPPERSRSSAETENFFFYDIFIHSLNDAAGDVAGAYQETVANFNKDVLASQFYAEALSKFPGESPQDYLKTVQQPDLLNPAASAIPQK